MSLIQRILLINLFLLIILLIYNFFLGTKYINIAHEQSFRGGECFAREVGKPDICQKKYGFDIYVLHVSFGVTSLILGIIYGFVKKVNNRRLFLPLNILILLLFIEIIIKIFSIPVLYSNPYELRQSLHYHAFLLFGPMQLIGVILITQLTGFTGLCIGKISYQFGKKMVLDSQIRFSR